MQDVIWYNLFEELNAYFQANNLSDFKGYAHKPQTVSSIPNKYYYFALESENEINIFDIDGTRIEDTRPNLTFNILIGTKAADKTDTTRKSANLAMFNATKAVRQELYNYRYSGVGMASCLYGAVINNIREVPQEEGTQAINLTEINITIFYNKTGAL